MWCIIFPDIKNVKVKGIKMNFFRFISLLETPGGTGGTGNTPTTGNEGGWFIYVMLGLMAVWFVWSLISGKKKKKKEQEELNSLQPGDEITTIGGIIGKVVSIKEETFVLETTKDKTRIRFHKGAVRTIDVKVADIAKEKAEAAKAEAPKEESNETAQQ